MLMRSRKGKRPFSASPATEVDRPLITYIQEAKPGGGWIYRVELTLPRADGTGATLIEMSPEDAVALGERLSRCGKAAYIRKGSDNA